MIEVHYTAFLPKMQEEFVNLHILPSFLLYKITITVYAGKNMTKLHKCFSYTNSRTSNPAANTAASTIAGMHKVPSFRFTKGFPQSLQKRCTSGNSF